MLTYDVVVIGGGIHGCAAAANAASRGLTVLLVEKDDLAAHTSSASSKLIHGGLRYLAQGEFRLVFQALKARRDLLEQAPHLVRPLPFVLPCSDGQRSRWKIQLGLKLYDILSFKDHLPHAKQIRRGDHPQLFSPLHPHIEDAFLFYDAQTDDARLTIENALRAQHAGATIRPRTALTKARLEDVHWQLTLSPQDGKPYCVSTKAIINTAGPWVNQVLTMLNVQESLPTLAWVKGSHLILPRLSRDQIAFILPVSDQRVVFCTPYHGATMLGTTEVTFHGDLNHLQMDAAETAYLFKSLQRYINLPYRAEDIVGHWCGIRTLMSERNRSMSQLTRQAYVHTIKRPLPIISLYGGKLTTHQHTANTLINALKTTFPQLQHNAFTPGPFPGAITAPGVSYQDEIQQIALEHPWVPATLLQRYIHQYGTRTRQLLQTCTQLEDLGEPIVNQLYEKEIDFLRQHEWATSSADILYRRTALGWWCGEEARMKLADYLERT